MPKPMVEASLELPVADLRTRDVYALMTSLVSPRPIAWVSTVDASGRANLAPFSYFQAMCSDPPVVVLGIGWKPDGSMKDTLANILETQEFVVNHVATPHVAAMNLSSAELAHDESEWEFAHVDSIPAKCVRPRRVATARAGMECKLMHALPLGQRAHGGPSTTMIVAQVLHFFVEPSLLPDAGSIHAIDPNKLESVGRLGGLAYAKTTDTFELPRPAAPTRTKS